MNIQPFTSLLKHYSRYFKAGGVEFQLDQPHIQGSLSGMLDAHPKELRELITGLGTKIQAANGGRVLWIDEQPHNIVGERRFLRSLGIEVVPAGPETVRNIITQDNDFDLIISDIQWRDEHGMPTYGGMNFVKELRDNHRDPVIRILPVIFYTAYRQEQVERIVSDVGLERYLKIDFSHSVESLVQQSITAIAESRSNPPKVGKKRPT